MIFGTDESRFQSYEALAARIAAGEHSFVILNVDDPDFTSKAQLCEANRYLWGVYVYMLPGVPGDYDLDKMIMRASAVGGAKAGYWFDYEEAGVEPWQLARGFGRADDLGIADRVGYYSSVGALDHGPFSARRYWLAQYPGRNDGSFPGMVYRAPRPVDLWQYTSGANSPDGGLDENVVVDEAWWAQLTGGQSGDDDMAITVYELTSDTPTAGIAAGSKWADLGTRFARPEDVGLGGAPTTKIAGDLFEALRADKIALTTSTGGDGTPCPPCPSLSDYTQEQLLDELCRRR